MLLLAKFIAIFVLMIGIIYLLSAKATRAMLDCWGKGKRFYIAGILRILFGTILLLAASQAQNTIVLIAVGILFLIGGILIFATPYEKSESAIQWFKERSNLVLRLFALPLIAIGALLLYSL